MPFRALEFSQEWQGQFKETDFAWLAGIVEGDGWMRARRNKNYKTYPEIGIQNTDTAIIHRVGEIFETKPTIQKQSTNSEIRNTHTLLRISVKGKRAKIILERIKPFVVGEKKVRLEMLLKMG